MAGRSRRKENSMQRVNLLETKTIRIRVAPAADVATPQRIGAARGLFEVPDDIDSANGEIAKRMLGTT